MSSFKIPYQSPVAGQIPFDNSSNGFASENIQAAIEEAKAGASFNNKMKFHIASLSSYDKIVTINYLDQGTKYERISSVVYSSVLYPNTSMTKTVFWLDVGRMNQRIEKVEYTGSVLTPNKIRKKYNYAAVGIRYRLTGFELEIF